jgi:broad specificity phosphatase PhoE
MGPLKKESAPFQQHRGRLRRRYDNAGAAPFHVSARNEHQVDKFLVFMVKRMAMGEKRIWLIRHGETEWSLSGQHTGKTDIPLTELGERRAVAIGRELTDKQFAAVLTSPRSRALETARLAGYGGVAEVDNNLEEWDYGAYEGITTADIRKHTPGWLIWDGPVPQGETIEQVAARADRAIARASEVEGEVALFAHGHILRVLTARWLGLPAKAGQLFALETGSISILGYERETRVISRWNLVPAVQTS